MKNRCFFKLNKNMHQHLYRMMYYNIKGKILVITESTLIVIYQSKLAHVIGELARLHERLDKLQLSPKKDRMTVNEYAATIGRSKRTVERYINDGKLDVVHECGVRMILLNQGVLQ